MTSSSSCGKRDCSDYFVRNEFQPTSLPGSSQASRSPDSCAAGQRGSCTAKQAGRQISQAGRQPASKSAVTRRLPGPALQCWLWRRRAGRQVPLCLPLPRSFSSCLALVPLPFALPVRTPLDPAPHDRAPPMPLPPPLSPTHSRRLCPCLLCRFVKKNN